MKKSVIIIVPSLKPTSPIKGAFALANIFIKYTNVSIVPLNSSPKSNELISDPKIKIIKKLKFKNKISIKNFFIFKNFLNLYLKKSHSYIVISFCLIPDIYTALLKVNAIKIASIRANNIDNYSFSFGILGIPLAILHYLTLNLMDEVIVMHEAMAKQIGRYLLNKQKIKEFPNFIEKSNINYDIPYPSKKIFKIIFVGWLDPRKDPICLLESIKILKSKGYSISLEFFGEGLLKNKLNKTIEYLGLTKNVFVRGYSKDIKIHLLKSHLMILPSWSEGLSRACLESLELGVPCILRDIYGNSDIIQKNKNGLLFKNNKELVGLIEYFLNKYDYSKHRNNLLPQKYRRHNIIESYRDLLIK